MPREEEISDEETFDKMSLIPKKRQKKSSVVSIIVIVVALALLIVAGWFAFDQYNLQVDKSAQTADNLNQNQSNVSDLLNKVGRHIVLPVGENPSVIDITNIDNLVKQQSFYVGAKNGDKIIIYALAQKTIIYDEERDILVNVGPLFANVSQSTSTPAGNTNTSSEISSNTPEQAAVKPATLEIRNGTTKTGWAKTNSNLFVNSPIFTITKVTTATKTTYPVTIVVNQKNVDVSTLENRYEVVATGKMPAGEAPSDADVVLILGLK